MRDFAVRSGADDGAESLVLPFARLSPYPPMAHAETVAT